MLFTVHKLWVNKKHRNFTLTGVSPFECVTYQVKVSWMQEVM